MPTDPRALATCPYARFVGLELTAIGDGHARVRLPYTDATGNRNGSLHGGVTASLLDVAGMLAAQSAPSDVVDLAASTIDLAVHYLAPAVREGVSAQGTVTRRGREIVFVETRVTSDAGTPIARGVG
ncbi:MAG: PaaI family thioesterase, partial [Candidatus Binatia bacterium]